MPDASLRDVRAFWEGHPVAATSVVHEPGTPEFFAEYDRLREANEPIDFSYRLHEYRDFVGKRVLDVGCGNGYVLSRYAREGADTYGIDLTETAVGLSRRRFELSRLEGRFVVGSAEDCAEQASQRPELHMTPPPASAEELRALYQAAY